MELLRIDGTGSTNLWIKRDDQTHSIYGGNKVRKLEFLLQDACESGAKRIITFGAVGSHHVLATTLHAQRLGIPVAAVLTPQPATPHARTNVEQALLAGLQVLPCRSLTGVASTLLRHLRRGDYVIAPGGSTPVGSLGYAHAACELEVQVRAGQLPAPDVIVVALGSGGTAAGLLAGLLSTSLAAQVVGVRVVDPPLVSRASTLALAYAAAQLLSLDPRGIPERFVLEPSMLGRGYGHPTLEGSHAQDEAQTLGLHVDETYTAKTFAHALALARSGRFKNILYWHTLTGPCPSLPSPPLPRAIESLLLHIAPIV